MQRPVMMPLSRNRRSPLSQGVHVAKMGLIQGAGWWVQDTCGMLARNGRIPVERRTRLSAGAQSQEAFP